MPLGARTTPSRRRVLTCKPAFPAGSGPVFLPPPASRPTMDSKASRRAMIGRAGPGIFPLGVPAAAFFSAGFFAVPAFFAGFADFARDFAAALGACTEGLGG